MYFEIVSEISEIITMESARASATSNASASSLVRVDGVSRKGIAHVRFESGRIRRVELHWYEAHGIGKKKIKIKRYLD